MFFTFFYRPICSTLSLSRDHHHSKDANDVDTAAAHCRNKVNRRYFFHDGMIGKCDVFKDFRASIEPHWLSSGACKHSCSCWRTQGVMKHAWEPAVTQKRISHPYLMGLLVCPWRQGGLWCNKWSGGAEAINEIISRINDNVNPRCCTTGQITRTLKPFSDMRYVILPAASLR